MNRKCEERVTVEERRTFTKVLSADKDKVHRDQAVGNGDKDAMLGCESGFHPSEDKLQCTSCHIYVTSIMIVAFLMFFSETDFIIRFYISICGISFVAFPCILYSHVVQECFCGIK